MMKTTAAWLLAGAFVCAPAFAQQTDGGTQGDLQRAKTKISMCVGCHGIDEYRTAYPQVYRVPMIAGQAPQYLSSALHAYKSGERSHPSMRGIAASLSEADIADLAAYYGRPQAK